VSGGEGQGEDEGYLLSYCYDSKRQGSDLVVLDARRPSSPPLCVIRCACVRVCVFIQCVPTRACVSAHPLLLT
jgi:carotenoid cleavage dioxygenase-like enzyme